MSRPAQRDACRHAEQRAVAAQHDDQIDVARQVFARSRSRAVAGPGQRRRLGLEHRLDAAFAQPRGKPIEVIGRGAQATLGDDADAGDAEGS